MSQRKAKEYRQAMRQYGGVVEDVDDLKRRVGALEVYRRREDREAAFDRRCLRDLLEERQGQREEVKKQAKTLKYELLAVVIVLGLLCVLVLAKGVASDLKQTVAQDIDAASLDAILVSEYGTDEETLLASGYYSAAVPMCYEWQGYMREYCREYDCPYPLALAVAETESNFNMDAVGGIGEIGIMQLNPGPNGTYYDALEQATGLDPTTPEGNIAGGCYLLGQYLAEYGDAARSAMAYSMGRSGAAKAQAAGTSSTSYTDTVLEAMARWECTVNPWAGA